MAAATAVIILSQEHDLNLCWQSGWGGTVCRYQKNRQDQEDQLQSLWEQGCQPGLFAKSRKVPGGSPGQKNYSEMGRVDHEMLEARGENGHVRANGRVKGTLRESPSISRHDEKHILKSGSGTAFHSNGGDLSHTAGNRSVPVLRHENGCAHEAELEDPEIDAPSDDATLFKMAEAVKVLLHGLGEDLNRDGLMRTPLRMAKALRFATKGYRESVSDAIGTALFALPGSSHGGTVVVRDVDTFSHCRACLLPFRCRCHIAYVPGAECVVGLSKLARLAEVYSRRLQTPLQLAQDIADGLASVLAARGVAVVVESWHIRSFSEAERTPGATVSDWVPSVAAAASGCFCEPEEGLWEEFVAMLGLDPEVESALETPPEQGSKAPARLPPQPVLCPFSRPEHSLVGRRMESDTESDEGSQEGGAVFSEIAELDEERPCAMHQDAERGHREQKRMQGVIGEPDAREAALPQMVAAMETLLHAAGGDPGSDDVSTTSERYVRWLLSATQGSQLTLEWALAQRAPAQQNGCLHPHLGGVPVYKSLENGSANGDHRGQANGHAAGRHECAQYVTELSVPLVSQCEHHLLPFLGKAHVGYVLGGKSRRLERGQVEKIVALYSQRLQVQERLTKQIAEAIASSTLADGVIVVVEASHMCMMSRGIEKMASSTATMEMLGLFENDPKARARFLRGLPRRQAGI